MIRFRSFIRESIDDEYPKRGKVARDLVVMTPGWSLTEVLRDPVTAGSDASCTITCKKAYVPSIIREMRERLGAEPDRVYCSALTADKIREDIRAFNLGASPQTRIKVKVIGSATNARMDVVLAAISA